MINDLMMMMVVGDMVPTLSIPLVPSRLSGPEKWAAFPSFSLSSRQASMIDRLQSHYSIVCVYVHHHDH